MHIRPMRRDDLWAVAQIGTQAFACDELFGWLMPRHEEFPDHLRRRLVLSARRRLIERGMHGLIAETDEEDPNWWGTPETTGYAFWLREGSDQAANKWQQDPLSHKLERLLLRIESTYEAKVVDRATDPKRAQTYDQACLGLGRDPQPGYWYCSQLAVSPHWQRRGIGHMLVRWGLQRSTEEDVPAALESSLAGMRLYRKLGFVIADSKTVVNDLVGTWLLWEPEHLKGKWMDEYATKQG